MESAKDRIRKLSEIVERSSPSNVEEEVSLKTEIIKQKEEMIQCLQDELIKVRLAEAENDENLRDLNKKVSELEEVGIISISCGPIIFATYIASMSGNMNLYFLEEL